MGSRARKSDPRRTPSRRVRRLARRTLERLGLLGPIYRAAERRLSRQAPAAWPAEVDGIPAPTPHLVTLVAGHASLESFLDQGRHISDFIAGLAARHGQPIEAAPVDNANVVLDFGCGCGRLARFLAPRVIAAGGRFIGSDINRELVAWSVKSLPGEYRLNRLKPPLRIEAASVRLMYAVSVFTHLPRASMDAWLADFVRVLAPGGVALISFADQDRAPPDLRVLVDRDGFAASTRSLAGSNYMASYAATEAFRALCARHLEVLEIVPSLQSGETLAWAVLRRPA